MINGSFSYAFGLGMVAAVNPCGFAMLPAYLGYFLGLEGDDDPDRSVLRALAVGLTVTAGFVAVFAVVGYVIENVSRQVLDALPYATVVIGLALAALAVAMLFGFQPIVKLPKFQKGTGSAAGLDVPLRRVVRHRVAHVHDRHVPRAHDRDVQQRERRVRCRGVHHVRARDGLGRRVPHHRDRAREGVRGARVAPRAPVRAPRLRAAPARVGSLRRVLRVVRDPVAGRDHARPHRRLVRRTAVTPEQLDRGRRTHPARSRARSRHRRATAAPLLNRRRRHSRVP
jgi:hypothetical protein